MADKSFGVKQLDVLGTGTPTISAPNILNLDCHTVAISTSITIGENLTVSGNVDLGNASSDTISLTGVVDTNIIPSADSSKDIGSNSVRFANGYFDTVYGSGANLTNLPPSAPVGGASTNQVFFENDKLVEVGYQITSTKNAMSAGPISVSAGIAVTIPSGCSWTIV